MMQYNGMVYNNEKEFRLTRGLQISKLTTAISCER